MHYVIKLLFSIPRTISHNFHFNSSTEGSISKFQFETANSASSSTVVDALKFRLLQYNKLFGSEEQEDASECLMMLIELINKGSVPYCGYNDNDLRGVSLSEILFSFNSIQNSLLPRKYNKYIQYTTYQQFIFKAMGTGHLLVYVSYNYMHTTISLIKVEQRCSCADH